ncbi:MAG TPA: hypothetical protein VMP01_18480 [Pirellulaceae bacterium]|nr:hypothetical protein [Pirellulaceae bacterium]
MTRVELLTIIVNSLVALGTLALAVFALLGNLLALFGNRLQDRLFGPNLTLVLKYPKGRLFKKHGKRFYCLQVENTKPKTIATNCHVQIRTMSRRMPNGDFVDIPLLYPLILSWPPSEYTPVSISIRRDQPVDFGFVAGGIAFVPLAKMAPDDFLSPADGEGEGLLRPGGTMRFELEIVSDQFVSLKWQTFEVSWNGAWSEDDEAMSRNLKIREI